MGETAREPDVVVVRGERGVFGAQFCRGLGGVEGWVEFVYIYAVEVCCLFGGFVWLQWMGIKDLSNR